ISARPTSSARWSGMAPDVAASESEPLRAPPSVHDNANNDGESIMKARQPLFEPRTSFFLPEILTRIPARCHPKAAETEKQSAEWVRRSLAVVFTSEQRMERFLETRCASLACAIWPDTRDDWMLDLANLCQHLFVFDDAYGDRDGIGR